MVRAEQRGVSHATFRAIRRRVHSVVTGSTFQARNEARWFGRADEEVRRPRGQILPEEGAPTAEALRNMLEGEPAPDSGQGYNQRYFQANREPLNEKRRERRRKARAAGEQLSAIVEVDEGRGEAPTPPCQGW